MCICIERRRGDHRRDVHHFHNQRGDDYFSEEADEDYGGKFDYYGGPLGDDEKKEDLWNLGVPEPVDQLDEGLVAPVNSAAGLAARIFDYIAGGEEKVTATKFAKNGAFW